MRITYTVSAKVETKLGDGTIQYMFHGSFEIETGLNDPGNSEALQLAMRVPQEQWETTDVGDSLIFDRSF